MQLKKSLLGLQPLLMVAPDPKGLLSLALAKGLPPVVPTWGEKVQRHHPGGAQGRLTPHLALTHFLRPTCLSGKFPFFPPLLQQIHLQQWLRILKGLDSTPWTAPRSHSQAPTPKHQAPLSWISSILPLLAQKYQQGFAAWADVSTQSPGGAPGPPISAGVGNLIPGGEGLDLGSWTGQRLCTGDCPKCDPAALPTPILFPPGDCSLLWEDLELRRSQRSSWSRERDQGDWERRGEEEEGRSRQHQDLCVFMSWCKDLPADMKTGRSFVVNHLKMAFFAHSSLSCDSWISQSQSFPTARTLPPLPSFPLWVSSCFQIFLESHHWVLAPGTILPVWRPWQIPKSHPSLASHPSFGSSFAFPSFLWLILCLSLIHTSAVPLTPCSFLPSCSCPLGARTLLYPNAIFFTLNSSSARKKPWQLKIGLDWRKWIIPQSDGNTLSQGILFCLRDPDHFHLWGLIPILSSPAKPSFLSWVWSCYSPIIHSVLSTQDLSLVLVFQLHFRALLPAQRPPHQGKIWWNPPFSAFLDNIIPCETLRLCKSQILWSVPSTPHLESLLVACRKQDLNSWKHKICSFWNM